MNINLAEEYNSEYVKINDYKSLVSKQGRTVHRPGPLNDRLPEVFVLKTWLNIKKK